jgi:hypothetical protein
MVPRDELEAFVDGALNKAVGPHTHPVKLTVSRKGKTFQQTFHVGKQPSKAEHKKSWALRDQIPVMMSTINAILQENRYYVPRAFFNSAQQMMQHIHFSGLTFQTLEGLEDMMRVLIVKRDEMNNIINKHRAITQARFDEEIDVPEVTAAIAQAIVKCDVYSTGGIEHAVVIARNGTTVVEADGDKNSVDIKDSFPVMYAHSLVHNHPPIGKSGDEYTFSDADLFFASDHGLQEIYAVASKHIYRMHLTKRFTHEQMMAILTGAAEMARMKFDANRDKYNFQREAVKNAVAMTGWEYEVINK